MRERRKGRLDPHQGVSDRRKETLDTRQGSRDRRKETLDTCQGSRDRRKGTLRPWQGTRDRRKARAYPRKNQLHRLILPPFLQPEHQKHPHTCSSRPSEKIQPVTVPIREVPLHQLDCARECRGQQERPPGLPVPVAIEEEGKAQ